MVTPFNLTPAWLRVVLLILFAAPALAARIEVSLDRNPVPLNEGFTLIFASDESPDGDPDFTPLRQDFEILSSPMVSSSTSIVNGRASQHYEWRIAVMGKRAGTLEIPAIAFGADHSQPFSVTILPGSAKRPGGTEESGILLEVDAEPKTPYVQAQVVYTVRVLSRMAIGDARLDHPEAADALIQKLEGEQNGITTRNGVQYRMTEVRYAIFPQKSGPLRIGPVRLEAQIATGGGRSLFDPFFSSATRTTRLQSEPVELNVRPIPAAFAGKHWLPATHVELEDSWAGKPPRTGAGEPATRTLSLRAEGVTVGLLPELSTTMAAVAGLKQYPDQPLLQEEKLRDGLASLRREKTALIASQPGTYRLPAIEIPWWNTKTDRPEIARLPERVLTVVPGVQTPESKPPVPEAASATKPASAETAGAVTQPAPEPAASPWPWLALLFGLGWLSTAGAWWLARRREPRRPPTDAAQTPPERRLIAAIENACRGHDAKTARAALAAWADHRWPDSGGQGMVELERRGGTELRQELDTLKRALYTRSGPEWLGAALWRSFQEFLATEKARRKVRTTPELEPLYKKSVERQ